MSCADATHHGAILQDKSVCLLAYTLKLAEYILYNYPPKWRWLAVDIYRAAKRWGKYPPLATDTEGIIVLVFALSVNRYGEFQF